MKEIKLSPEYAKVKAEHDEHYAGEYKEQLLMETRGWAQKWITVHCKTSWIEIHFNERVHTVCGVGFVSADDCPNRDPIKVTISYFD